MLLTAVSRRCFSSDSRCLDARCWCESLRTTRNSRAAIASTESPVIVIRIPICSRQSANAADVVVEATITIGKFVSVRDEISRSSPSIGLVRRDVLRGCSKICRSVAGPFLKFLPTISATCG